MTEPLFSLTMKVRDYECDLQGIVNNAVYQHYTEHTRSEFLRANLKGVEDFHARGIDTVVARLQMQFKASLCPGDVFRSDLWLRKDGIKYVFLQDIVRAADGKLCMRAETTVVCRVNGRLGECKELDALLPE